MLGNFSTDGGLVSQSTHWSTLWFDHTYPCELTHDDSPSNSVWITIFMEFIPISSKASSTGTPTVVIISTNISGSQDTCMLSILNYFVGPPINLTCGRFTIGIGLSAYILSFLNTSTLRWSTPSFPMLIVLLRTLLLIHYPHHSPYTILWLSCIEK